MSFIFYTLLCVSLHTRPVIFKNINTYCSFFWEVSHFWNNCDFLPGKSIFELMHKEPNLWMCLGLVLPKLFRMTIRRKKVKITATALLLTGMFFGSFHKVSTVLCQLVGLKNKKQSYLSGVLWPPPPRPPAIPRSLQVLRALDQTLQCDVIYSVFKCHSSPSHVLLSDRMPRACHQLPWKSLWHRSFSFLHW